MVTIGDARIGIDGVAKNLTDRHIVNYRNRYFVAKPKGFNTMCWINIILNGFGISFGFLIAAYDRIGRLVDWPSLVELEVFESDVQILYMTLGIFVWGAQAAMLVDMLRNRKNRIRGLVLTTGADIALTYLETLALPNDPFNSWSILITFLLSAILLMYFCRKSVYEYLNG